MVKDWILRLRINVKLLLAFGSILVLSVALMVVGLSAISKILDYNELSSRIEQVNVKALKMSSNIREFIEFGFKADAFQKSDSSIQLLQYNKRYRELVQELDTLHQYDVFSASGNDNKLNRFLSLLQANKKHVQELSELLKRRGFQDYGIEGELREAIHQVEDANVEYDKALMLMLRRHEKDFFLRKDLKYLDRFKNGINELKTHISSTVQEPDLSMMLNTIDEYAKKFNTIVSVEEQIGLGVNDGKKGVVKASFEDLENYLDELNGFVQMKNDQLIQSSWLILISLLAVQLIFGLTLVIFYANLLSKSIKEIRSALVSLSEGIFPDKLKTKTKDEIADAKLALNQVIDGVKSAVDFASEIGKGNLTAQYPEAFKQDVLAKSLIATKEQLYEAESRQKTINWMNKGMAKFTDILKAETQDIESLADDIIAQMVKYLNANQGALYIDSTEHKQLERIATYAYGKKKYVEQEVAYGAGQVGQCYLEKSTILLKDIPDQYTKITSGLGEATPREVLIIPLMIREEVTGVIELASFESFTNNQIEFVEKVSESIANILVNKRTNERTKQLLEEAENKTAEMQSAEEELRQNSEELQATQEELERQRTELLDRISELEKQQEEIT